MRTIEGQTGGQAFAIELGRRMERIIEALIGSAVSAESGSIRGVVLSEFTREPRIVGRRAVLLASAMAATYVRRFAPPRGWRLAGRGVRVGTGRADLLFTDGALWFVDELKAARLRPDDPALAHQVERYQRANDTYGDVFLGVRVALLRAPTQLLLFPATGARQPLPPARSR